MICCLNTWRGRNNSPLFILNTIYVGFSFSQSQTLRLWVQVHSMSQTLTFPSKKLVHFLHNQLLQRACWHAAIYPAGSATVARQAQASHSNRELCSMQGGFQLCMSSRAGSSRTVLTWNFCDSQLALSHGHPTDTHSIIVSGSKLPCMLRTHSTWVIFAPRGSSHADAIALK